ncbi:hypothetical protein KTT_00530 [Tengunoibacter tsumagoiensis]|uniref:Uncharacterized protein n=1 Tax=Tengunoibacter tsumagoiensis TaxID=2014871 RepID=A0A401ZTV0_9CHLR|nr:hypothetical protein KTT_00530 [Tengunoibacter tsumagoiensis]
MLVVVEAGALAEELEGVLAAVLLLSLAVLVAVSAGLLSELPSLFFVSAVGLAAAFFPL